MEAKREEINLKFGPNGTTLDDGLKILRSIINELKRNLPKKFEITMKATGSNTPYVSKILVIENEKTKTKESLCRYKNIDFEKELRHHSWKPKPQARKKQIKEVAESSIIQKSTSIHYYINYKFRKSGAVQQQQVASYR
jgi:hypothetical protein